MADSKSVSGAVPYTRFESKVDELSRYLEGEDIILVYSGGEWDIRIGDPSGFSESVAGSAFECVLDCLEN